MKHSEKIKLVNHLKSQLIIKKDELSILGLTNDTRAETLAKQLVDSIRRISYIYIVCERSYDGKGVDPTSSVFDPYKLISNFVKKGETEEAYWLCFLVTYCGKNLKNGWSSLKTIYAGNGKINYWKNISQNTEDFLDWLDQIGPTIKTGFGNHRKYETFQPTKGKGPRSVISSYLNLVKSTDGSYCQKEYYDNCKQEYGDDPEELFDSLYKKETSKIVRFGRLSKFDYLTLLTKVGLIALEPPEAYIGSSTGPKSGLSLLFLNNSRTSKPSSWHKQKMALLKFLDLGPLKMQVLEDALCNWQKSPSKYISFRG